MDNFELNFTHHYFFASSEGVTYRYERYAFGQYHHLPTSLNVILWSLHTRGSCVMLYYGPARYFYANDNSIKNI